MKRVQGWLGGVHYAWLVVAVTFVAIFAASGLRGSFGVFLKPLEAEFGWDRAAVSGVAALSLLLYGVGQPLIGRLVDSVGPRAVMVGSLLLLGLTALATAGIQELWQLYLTYGVLLSLAAGGASLVTVSAITAHWFATRRALVIGIATSGVSAGQTLLIPLAMWLTVLFGWRMGFVGLAAIVCLIAAPLVWLFVRTDPADLRLRPFGAASANAEATSGAGGATSDYGTPLRDAVRSGPFWLLAGSYFICGYSSNGLIGTHMVPYAIEHGVAEIAAASALGLMGAVNILGGIGAGYASDRFGRRNPLALTYVVRGLATLWLMTVRDPWSLHVFAVLFGLSFVATVPPTTALTADLFGRRSVAFLLGWIFLAHQVGAAAGSLLGGVLYELTGDYLAAFFTSALLCFAAASMVLAIRTPARPTLTVAPAT
jgi:MFS family permease